jgi:hypothetical protein
MKSQSFLVSLIYLLIITGVLVSHHYLTYDQGLRDGKSQCYPYSVPHAESIGRGGNHD